MLIIHLCYMLHSKILGWTLYHINLICEYLCRRDTAAVFMGPDCQTVFKLHSILTISNKSAAPDKTVWFTAGYISINRAHLSEFCCSPYNLADTPAFLMALGWLQCLALKKESRSLFEQSSYLLTLQNGQSVACPDLHQPTT